MEGCDGGHSERYSRLCSPANREFFSRDDDAVLRGIVRRLGVETDRRVLERLGRRLADERLRLLVVDGLVMVADRRLRRRGEQDR